MTDNTREDMETLRARLQELEDRMQRLEQRREASAPIDNEAYQKVRLRFDQLHRDLRNHIEDLRNKGPVKDVLESDIQNMFRELQTLAEQAGHYLHPSPHEKGPD